MGTYSGDDEGDSGFWGYRRPFLYDPEVETLYLGQPGSHHMDLNDEFGVELGTGEIVEGCVAPVRTPDNQLVNTLEIFNEVARNVPLKEIGEAVQQAIQEPVSDKNLSEISGSYSWSVDDWIPSSQMPLKLGYDDEIEAGWGQWWDVGNPAIAGESDSYRNMGLDAVGRDRRPWVVTNDGTVVIGNPGEHHVDLGEWVGHGDLDWIKANVRSLGIVDDDGKVWMYEVSKALPQDHAMVQQEFDNMVGDFA